MNLFNHHFFGISAGVISVLSFIPYIRAILKGSTRPSGPSWWTWFLITTVTVSSSWASGATWQVLILPIWLCFSQAFIALLSLKRGDNNWDKLNIFCIGFSVVGLLLWLFTKQPLYALALSILADIFASIPNIRHVWKNPEQEDKLAWSLGWLSSLLQIFAISIWTLAEAGWTSYFFVSMTITLVIIFKPSYKFFFSK